MSSNTEHTFHDRAQGRLAADITAAVTSCSLVAGDVLSFLPRYEASKEFYCTLVDSSANREIVKVTAISGDTFTIARGQDGSTAKAWYAGTLIEARPVAANFTRFMQKLDFRTIYVNPNNLYSASYPGEKVYQSGDEDCQKRWWKNVTGAKWRLIAGEMCTWEARDEDGYIRTLQWISNDLQTGGYAADVWGDGQFIYVANYGRGIDVFSVSDEVVLTHFDNDDQGGNAIGVWGDGTFIYLANQLNGIEVYSVSAEGILTHLDHDDQGGIARGVWGDGDYIYLANGARGVEVYSVDEAGTLTHVHNALLGGSAQSVWGDGTFIYLANYDNGLYVLSVDSEGTLTYADGDDQGGYAYHVWGDGELIYVANGTSGIEIYWIYEGALVHLDSVDTDGGAVGIWGDGEFIYLADTDAGMNVYSAVEVTPTLIVNNDQGGTGAQKVWGDGTFIYLANYDHGLEVYSF